MPDIRYSLAYNNIMRNSNNHSIYPYLVAEFIEAKKDGGTVDAIKFMTHENLKELKDTHQRKIVEEKTTSEAESREKHIFAVLTDIEHSE
jgi:hypothetical protein